MLLISIEALYTAHMIAPASPRLTTTLPAAQASAIRAAKTASVSPHALINLVRLVKGIESRAPEVGATGDSPVLDLKKRDQEVLRDGEVSRAVFPFR